MLITGTSDKIQFKLGSTATTQLPFTVDYNNYTSTTVSLVTNNGTSNDTAAVDLVPSPSSNQQNELRYCSIYNADSASETVIIQVYDGTNTRVVFRAVLASGDTLQYQLEKGWEIINKLGNKKTNGIQIFNNNMQGSAIWRPAGITTNITITSGNNFLYAVLGRVEKAYSSIDVNFIITTAPTTVSIAEVAIYTSPVTTFGGTQFALGRRLGAVSIVGNTSLGPKKINVPITGTVNVGELLFVVFTSTFTGTFNIKGTAMADSTAIYFHALMQSSVTGGRPSLVETGPYLTAASNPVWVNWQGN